MDCSQKRPVLVECVAQTDDYVHTVGRAIQPADPLSSGSSRLKKAAAARIGRPTGRTTQKKAAEPWGLGGGQSGSFRALSVLGQIGEALAGCPHWSRITSRWPTRFPRGKE